MRRTSGTLIAICLSLAAMAPTAVERSYLKLEGIKASSNDAAHSDWLQLTTFSWGATPAAGSTGPLCMAGPGGGPHTLRFAYIGAPSGLGNLYSQHRLIPSLTVEVNGQRHLLQGVTLTSYDAKPAGKGQVSESVSLNFTKCETHDTTQRTGAEVNQKVVAPDLKYLKYEAAPNSILIGLTPRPEAAALIGLLFNGDGHSARLTRKAGGAQDAFRHALQSRQVIPQLTLTLNNGQKWTFTNLTVAGITDVTNRGTESLSLNFTRVEGPTAGFQDLAYKE